MNILTPFRALTSMKCVRIAGSYCIAFALITVLSASGIFTTGAFAAMSSTTHSPSASSAAIPTLAVPVRCLGCWHPTLKTSWQVQFQGTLQQLYNVHMYDVDMFDTPVSTVASLHRAGRIAICYIDAGTWENWRSDASQFPNSVKGNAVGGWAGERWLDIRQQSMLTPIMKARMDQCKSKGFNGVEFDNVDGYTNNTGFPLTANAQLSYNIFLANEAHAHGLSVALKNDLDQVTTLLPYFDWALDEQCFQYNECNLLFPFIKANKAVMEAEYSLSTSTFCSKANAMNFNSMKKDLSLDTYRVACR